jgi:hypothetical protein
MDSRTLALVISTLAQMRGGGHQPSAARVIATEAVCAIFAIGTAAAAIGCAAVALWCLALPTLGPVWTPLLVALALLVVCAIALLVIVQISGRRREAAIDPVRYAETIGEQLSKALPSGSDIARLAKENAGTLSIAALVAGLVAGTSGFGRHR